MSLFVLALIILIAAVVLGLVAHPLFWLLAIIAIALLVPAFRSRNRSRL